MRYRVVSITGDKSRTLLESHGDPATLQEHAQNIMREFFPEGSHGPRIDAPNEIRILDWETGDVLGKWTIADEYRRRSGGA